MKKAIVIIMILTSIRASSFAQMDQYVLPIDLAGNPVIDPVGATTAGDISNTSYIDLTSQITKLQGDLGTQNDNLNTNKNLLQKYGSISYDSSAIYPDAHRLSILNTNLANAIKIIKSNIDVSKKKHSSC